MDMEWPAIASSAGRQVWRQLLVPIGQALIDDCAAVTQAAVDVMRDELAELFTDPQLGALIHSSTLANIERLGQMLVRGLDPSGGELPDETVVALQSGVRMQVGLSSLLRLYSLAHELVRGWVFERIVDSTETKADLAAASELASSWIFAFVDAATTRLAESYDREREAWFSSALAERAEAIAAILDGRERDAASASNRLRYDLRRHHVGVCVWLTDTTSSDPQRALNGAVRQLAGLLGVQNSLVSPLGSHAARGWLTRSRQFSSSELDALESWTAPTGVLVAVGSPGSGLEGFRRSQSEAAQARRLAVALADGAAVTRYEKVAVAALATVDHDQALAFARRVLGPLAAPDATTRRIAETLAVYFTEAGNRRRTGERLVVHANTVTYRIKQAESMLGERLPDDTLDLRLALAMLPYLRDVR